MNRYTIYCTESQTKKALGLGAPIEEFCGIFPTASINGIIYDIPTAEQMIGWLEEQAVIDDIEIYTYNAEWKFEVFLTNGDYTKCNSFHSRKEATIAAIDATLKYLSNNKKLL